MKTNSNGAFDDFEPVAMGGGGTDDHDLAGQEPNSQQNTYSTISTVDAEGRITVPPEIRQQLSLHLGTTVKLYKRDGAIVIEPQ